MKKFISLILPFALIAPAAHALEIPISKGVDSKSNCKAGEQILFSCQLKKRIFSVCASRDLDAKKGYMVYRVSKDGKTELEYPSSLRHPLHVFEHALLNRGGELTFENNGYIYTLYSDIGGMGSIQGDSIEVDKDGKEVSSFSCERTIDNTGFDLTPVIDLLTKAGIEAP
jgi:hypothetical protein